ncbi:uncharacterized protein LOC105204165 isoform X2 [Solenopsis invicta]|uniref:uncharacterized protein LOC105204165 isoform X2 n=1 Tax=Solenopsis invicta TaxID=13686 RepID=UPI000E34044D|nr:uncharacterized protein LOC105204165 isoform X2 [Solenopsis invicta]
MEKKVYCVIGERCKRITFSSNNFISDVKIVRDAFIKACNNDVVLRSMINNKEIVLQKNDVDRNNKLCDIEEDDEIEDKSEVNILLFEKPSSLVIESSSPSTSFISDITQDIPIDDTYGIKILHSEPIDIKVLHTELATDLNDFTSRKIQNSPVLTEGIKEKTLLQEDDKEREDYIATPHTSDVHDEQSVQSRNKQTVISKESSGSIPYPAVLPSLSYDLQIKLKTDGILKAQRYFIAHWGQYLWEATNTKPTKLDYSNLARSIVAAYSELAGGRNGCEIVRVQLSTWIRNHRANMKKNQTQKRDYEGKPKSATTFASVVQTSTAPTESDITNALKELEKKFMENNASHIKRLLKITMPVRRQWIENKSNRINEIVKKYPSLQYYEMVLCSTEDLTTSEKEAPRAVIYMTNEEIASAYIVADEIKVKIPQPTVHKVIAGLLSGYYVWHMECPKSYANILEYMEHEILSTSLKSRSTVLMKFVRDCDNLKTTN